MKPKSRKLNSVSREEIERWVTPPRFRAFLDASENDYAQAIALYDWNVCVSAVFFETISYAEVLLRNAIDAQFTPVKHDEPAIESWLFDATVLSTKSLEKVIEATDNIKRMKKAPTRARLVANLSFGFWKALLDKRYKDLWIERLHQAFPYGNGDRSEVASILSELNPFRNRLAHHEPVIDANIEKRHDDLLKLTGLMDKEAERWLRARSCVPEVLAWRPPLSRRQRTLALMGMTPKTVRFHAHG